ncbi:response regulator [bacterium]|nr:response regulator [bacterium]MBU1990434.1 response regulator [bacterium]
MANESKIEIESLKKNAQPFSVLYVEDEKDLRETIFIFLSKIFKKVDTASNGQEALEKYMKNKFDIVITDIQMPKMNGLELIRRIREMHAYQEIIIISAYSDTDYFTQSIQLNVTGYIIKPINFDKILKTLHQSIYKLTVFHENEMYKKNLEKMVQERTQTVLNLQNQQVDNYQHAIHSLVKMIEARDTYTGGHSERVASYSRDIARAMQLSDEECNIIYEAGILHDVGKIITPDAILLKPGKLSEDEYSLIKDHVTAGYSILSEIPMYNELSNIVYAHHEHFDGSGYPRGLKADEIPLLSRIMIIADAFDAMTTSRIYKAKKSIPEAIEELQKFSGIWYDSKVMQKAVGVLQSVIIDIDVTQDPSSHIDDERFAYFYKDPLTKVYNQYYLDFILQKNRDEKKQICLNIIYIKNFSSYNQKHGWSEGDILLYNFTLYLKSEFPASQIFRIFGDDFVVLSTGHVEIDIDKINQSPIFATNKLHCTCKHFHLEKTDIRSYKDLQD